MKRISSLFPLFIIIAVFPGCGSLIPQPDTQPRHFVLAHLPMTGEPSSKRSKNIVVDAPVVFSPLDSQRIASKVGPHELDFYADIEWAERLSVLLQDALVYSLQNTGFQAATRASTGVLSPYTLKTELRYFYIDRAAKKAKVGYFVQVVDTHTRDIQASREIVREEVLPEETQTAIITALNTAHLDAMSDLQAWLKSQIKRS